MNAVCPLTMVPTMPFLFARSTTCAMCWTAPSVTRSSKELRSAGFVGLAFYDSGARSIYAKKPIKTVADVKGMKVRVQQSDPAGSR